MFNSCTIPVIKQRVIQKLIFLQQKGEHYDSPCSPHKHEPHNGILKQRLHRLYREGPCHWILETEQRKGHEKPMTTSPCKNIFPFFFLIHSVRKFNIQKTKGTKQRVQENLALLISYYCTKYHWIKWREHIYTGLTVNIVFNSRKNKVCLHLWNAKRII